MGIYCFKQSVYFNYLYLKTIQQFLIFPGIIHGTIQIFKAVTTLFHLLSPETISLQASA